MKNVSTELIELLRQIADHDPNKKLTGPDPALAEKLEEGVLQRGREGVAGLVGLLSSGEEGVAWRARYLLYGLAIYVGRPDKTQYRAAFTEALALQLGGETPKESQCFVAQALQVAGNRDVAPALGKLLLDEATCESAAQALLAIRDGAAEQFRAALVKAQGKPRLTVVQALAVLADAPSAAALRQALEDSDRDVRLAAALGLANLADPGSADALLKAADVPDAWQRNEMIHACLRLAERLLAANKKDDARQIYQRLHDASAKPEDRHVRQAAAIGLAAAGA